MLQSWEYTNPGFRLPSLTSVWYLELTKSWGRRNFKKRDWLFRRLGTGKYWLFTDNQNPGLVYRQNISKLLKIVNIEIKSWDLYFQKFRPKIHAIKHGKYNLYSCSNMIFLINIILIKKKEKKCNCRSFPGWLNNTKVFTCLLLWTVYVERPQCLIDRVSKCWNYFLKQWNSSRPMDFFVIYNSCLLYTSDAADEG